MATFVHGDIMKMFAVHREINYPSLVAQFTGSEQGFDHEKTRREFICSGTLSQLFINPDFSPWKKAGVALQLADPRDS